MASLNKMLHDDYLCLVESGKQQIKEVRRKFNRKTWKQWQLLSESGFVLRIAPTQLSRDRRIKMKKSINHHAGACEVIFSRGGQCFDDMAAGEPRPPDYPLMFCKHYGVLYGA